MDNQKIESARESYSIKFLMEKFENIEDNKIRKEKLKQLLKNIEEDGSEQSTTRESQIP